MNAAWVPGGAGATVMQEVCKIAMSRTDFFLDGIDFSGCDLPPLLPLVHTVSTKKGFRYIDNNSLTKPTTCKKCEMHSCDNPACERCGAGLCDNSLKKPPTCGRCEVFPCDNPVYLFYGKPTYKKPGSETTNDDADHKMVFILKNHPKNPSDIIRVFPFDSGAFHHGFYSRYIDLDDYRLDDFKMSTDIKELPKHIYFFWGNNTNFLRYRNPKPINATGLSFAIKRYASLIGSKEKTPFDSRCSVPEVQSEKICCILDCLQAVLVSDAVYNNYSGSEIFNCLKNKNIEIHKYEFYGRESQQNISDVYICIREYYRSKEVL